MSILVNTISEQEEKILIAFLNSLSIQYKTDIENDQEIVNNFISHYNQDLDKANTDIEKGNFVSQQDVELLFEKRRKAMK